MPQSKFFLNPPSQKGKDPECKDLLGTYNWEPRADFSFEIQALLA